jgi:hypothetical protein
MTITDSTVPGVKWGEAEGLTPPAFTAEDKAARARMWAECPDWCDGRNHDEGVAQHSILVGDVDHVSVWVQSRKDGTVGVEVTGSDVGWTEPLAIEQAGALVEMIEHARRIAEAANADDSRCTGYPLAE